MRKSLIVPLVLWSGAITFLLMLVYALFLMWYSDNIRVVFFAHWFLPLDIGLLWVAISLIAVVKHLLLMLLICKHKFVSGMWTGTLLIAPWILFIPAFWSLFFIFAPPPM